VPVRLDPGRRAALAVGAAVVVAALATGIWLLTQRPRAVAVPTSSPAPSTAAPLLGSGSASAVPRASASPSVAAELVVDVAGKVRHPGLYRLPTGSRVDDAVHAAGGALPGTNLVSLNLAAKVADGQQIVVGVPGGAGGGVPGQPAGSPGAAAGGSPGGAVNLNAATIEQLESLPGVGPVLAQHILDWRTAHGGFTSIGQLQDVSGIGPAKFAAIKDLVAL
jgi:competence protein ComEA